MTPEPYRTCTQCGQRKPVREFYQSCRAECMECKRERSNAHKARTGYNRRYRLSKKELAK